MSIEQAALIKTLVGKKCHVYSDYNKLLFVGEIAAFDQEKNRVKIKDHEEEEVPWKTVVSDMKIKLRISLNPHEGSSKLVFIDCIVEQSVREYLLAGVKTVILKEESRDNFRQNVMADCIVSKAGDSENGHVCTVVNVSVKGVGIQSTVEYEKGELLEIINGKFRKEGPSHNLKCRIVRNERLKDGNYFYGCEFINMPRSEERSLMNDIFALQTQELRAKSKR